MAVAAKVNCDTLPGSNENVSVRLSYHQRRLTTDGVDQAGS